MFTFRKVLVTLCFDIKKISPLFSSISLVSISGGVVGRNCYLRYEIFSHEIVYFFRLYVYRGHRVLVLINVDYGVKGGKGDRGKSLRLKIGWSKHTRF